MKKETGHIEVVRRDPYTNLLVGIDRDISPLVMRLWSNDVRTFHSCQGDSELTPQAWCDDPNEQPNLYPAYVMLENNWRTIALTGHILAALSDMSDKMFQVEFDQFPPYYPFDPKVRGMNRLVWRFLNRDIEKITNLIC